MRQQALLRAHKTELMTVAQREMERTRTNGRNKRRVVREREREVDAERWRERGRRGEGEWKCWEMGERHAVGGSGIKEMDRGREKEK